MLPLQHILSQLGYAIICSIWQMGILWFVYLIISSITNPSPNTRFRLALLLSLTGTFWFLITILSERPSATLLASNIISNKALEASQQFLYSNWFMYAMGCAYLIFLLYAGIKNQIQWKITMHKTNEDLSLKAPVTLRLFVDKHATLLGIHRPVCLKISEIFSPSTYGFLKPVLLLPLSCLTQLSTYQIEALLLHELAHIRRNDYFWSVVLHMVEMVLYFNPFMRKLVREARKECEHACDDWVIQFGYAPKEYALALLDVAKNGYASGWALHASGAYKPFLLNRIARMLGHTTQPKKNSRKNILLTCTLIFSFVISLMLSNKKSVVIKDENLNFFTTDGILQTTLIPDNLAEWQQALVDTRTQIMKAGLEKTRAENEQRDAAISKAASDIELANSLKQKEAVQQFLANNQPEIPEFDTASAPLILSAGWAEQMGNPEAEISAIEKGWTALTSLIEKLETEKFLEESEWEQLAALITFHSNIREMIYRETRKTQYGILNTPALNEIKDSVGKEVLVIVYEEATGTLAASLMPVSAINHELNLTDLPEDEQKVIVLRKWLDEKRKVIRL